MERIITISTNRSYYDIKQAAHESMTVAELIEELRYLPEDAKIVFKNDGGYTFGHIMGRHINVEEVNSKEDEDSDDVYTREDYIADIEREIKKNNGVPIKCGCVWLANDIEIVAITHDMKGNLYAHGEDGENYPLSDFDDDMLSDIWFESTQIRHN